MEKNKLCPFKFAFLLVPGQAQGIIKTPAHNNMQQLSIIPQCNIDCMAWIDNKCALIPAQSQDIEPGPATNYKKTQSQAVEPGQKG